LLYEKIGNANEQDSLFGKNSMLATMIRAAKYHNKISRFDAIPLDDAEASVKAAGSIVFSGTPTATGTIVVTIGSKGNLPKLNHVYEIGVTSASTATTIGNALVSAITADATSPVTAVNTTGSVAITSVHGGTWGDSIGISISGEITGLTYVLTGMAGGVTNPILTTLFDVVGDTRYQTIVFPSYAKEIVKTFLDSRFNVNKKILDGVGVCCIVDSAANIESDVDADNSQCLAVISEKKINTPSSFYVAPGIFEIDTIVAAQFAAIRALRLTDGANISQYVSATYGSKDAFGGMHIASLPYFNTVIPTLPLEETGKNFTDDELSDLTTAGATVLGNNIANTQIVLGTTLTTYKTDHAGDEDVSFKYLEYVDTEVTCREYFYVNLRARFDQSRLTSGDVKPGYSMANEQIIAAFLTGLYVDLSNVALVRIGKDPQTGIDWLTYFKNNLVVELDLEQGLASVSMLLPIVTQLRAIRMTMQVSFSANN
jgi:phage tail sheath gpL-like